jgi:hypothetical protein
VINTVVPKARNGLAVEDDNEQLRQTPTCDDDEHNVAGLLYIFEWEYSKVLQEDAYLDREQ